MAAVGLAAFSCTFPDYRFDAEAPETCDNGDLDGDETKVDCGGSCDPCPCDEDEECPGADQVCVMGACRDQCENGECVPTCDDEKRNGDETGVDCGGSCEKRCPTGSDCDVPDDCVEEVCADGRCQPPTCDDGVHNGFEAWIDCGAECPTKCGNGEPCDVEEDCESETCIENVTEGGGRVCAPPLCTNRMLDEDEGESDIDCGGPCPDCEVGENCNADGDCIEKVCGDDGECAEPACDDGVKNGEESDTDCGRNETGCARCEAGDSCGIDEDCEDQLCSTEKECLEATCGDGVQNGSESDEDCGGSCDPCPLGDRCVADRDCVSGICDASDGGAACVSCDDQIRNGSELGTDCGGSDCNLCSPGHDCIADEGCVNYLCDGGECVTGLALDYRCHQCGENPNDQIKFTLTLRNLSSEAIDVSGVTVRYYLSTEVTNVSYVCEYNGEAGCGPPVLEASGLTESTATSHIETEIGPTPLIPANGSAELEVTVRLNGTQVDQTDDYSFRGTPQTDYQRVTLHRQGTLIWGNLPE